MRRRVFLGSVAAASLACAGAHAQRADPPLVAVMSLLSESSLGDQMAAFRAGLAEAGAVARIDFRSTDGDPRGLPALAADLIARRPAVLVAAGGNVSAAAAKAATSTIPVVFTGVRDPVQDGLVASMSRPGGNLTGVAIFAEELDAKRLELLLEVAPANGPVGALINRANPNADAQQKGIEAAGRAAGRALEPVRAGTDQEIEAAFARFADAKAAGVVVASDPYFTSRRGRIVELAARHRLPGAYQWRQFVEAGGLLSYGPDFNDAYRNAGVLVGRILRGERPATLPVIQPTRFELAVNLKTARNLGLAIPAEFLARADVVID